QRKLHASTQVHLAKLSSLVDRQAMVVNEVTILRGLAALSELEPDEHLSARPHLDAHFGGDWGSAEVASLDRQRVRHEVEEIAPCARKQPSGPDSDRTARSADPEVGLSCRLGRRRRGGWLGQSGARPLNRD